MVCSASIPICSLSIFLVFAGIHLVQAQRSCFPGTIRVGKECSMCPAGTYSDDFNLLECIPCQPGTFRETQGAQSEEQCIPCPSGTFARKEGSRACKKCPSGKDSFPGSISCGFCDPGSALNPFSETGCSTCLRAFFTDKPGSRFCERCPDGTVTGGGSDPFPSRGFGATSCTKCPKGRFRRNSMFDFNPISVFLSNKCEKCQPGTFSDEGAVACKICPPGTFSKAEAASCTACPKDTFSRTLPSRRCQRCPPGTSTAGPGAAGCKDMKKGCPFGTFENKSGVCQACLPGQRLENSRKECVSCGDKEVSEGGASTLCKRCSNNMSPKGNLSFLEKFECECSFGFVNNGKSCSPCPKGTFWENNNDFFLTTDGFKRTGLDVFDTAVEGVCTACPVGTFSDRPGLLFCKACPLNTFSDRAGATSCMKCRPGSRSPRLFDSETDTNRGKCVVDETGCEVGQVRNKNGECTAVECPSKNSFLFRKRCVQCSPGEKASSTRGCVRCKRRESGVGGASSKCERCPKGTEGSFGSCLCPGRKVIGLNGRCVEVCPAGTGAKSVATTSFREILSDDETVEICAKCPPREFSTGKSASCIKCLENMIAVNGTECKRCPKGEVVEKDIFGRTMDRCRPI